MRPTPGTWSQQPADAQRASVFEAVLVRAEPLAPHHPDDLWQQANDPEVWCYLPTDAAVSRRAIANGFCADLTEAAGLDVVAPAVIARSKGCAVGHCGCRKLHPRAVTCRFSAVR